MISKISKFSILSILVLSFANCGTIIHGSKQDVVIVSDPKKAQVNIDGLNVGSTPHLARLTRKNKHLVKVQLDGYLPYEITLKRKLDGWIFGNFLFGGIIGIAVDAGTGSMYRLTPTDIDAELKTNANSYNKNKDELYLAVVLKPNTNWTKFGELERAPADK
jgi:hypothetical protein